MNKTSFKAKIVFETKKRPTYFDSNRKHPLTKPPITYEFIYNLIKNRRVEIKEIITDELTTDFEPVIVIGDK